MSEPKPFKVHFAGLPTAPDVEKLNAKFGIPEEGTIIAWEEFEGALGIGRRTERFGTVVNAWRKRLFAKHNVFMGSERGKGLVALPPNKRIDHSSDRSKSGMRIIRKAIVVSSCTDKSRLTPDNKRVAEHFDKLGANMRLAAAASARGIVLPAID